MADLQVSIVLALAPNSAFDALVAELQTALARRGLAFEPGAKGRVTEGDLVVGEVTDWARGKGLSLTWSAPPWETGKGTAIDLRFRPVKGGTRVTLTHRGWGAAVGGKAEVAGWFAGEVVAPLLAATAPHRARRLDHGPARPAAGGRRGEEDLRRPDLPLPRLPRDAGRAAADQATTTCSRSRAAAAPC